MKPHKSSPTIRAEETHEDIALERKDWAGLPKHLLRTVLEKLESTVDYLQFDSVCVSWHSTKRDNHSLRLEKFPREVPTLLIPSREKYKWSIYDVMHKSHSDSKLSVPYDRHFSGSSQGWLFSVNKDRTVTLYNPFSRVLESNTIHLPSLFPYYSNPALEYEHQVEPTLCTANPITNPKECIVMVIFGILRELAFFRVGKDTQWNKVGVFYYYGRRFFAQDVLRYDNRFFVVDRSGGLVSFEVTDLGHSPLQLIAPPTPFMEDPPDLKRDLYIKSCKGEILGIDRYFNCRDVKAYLVKSKGDILLVERYLYWREDARVTVHCRVFKLDLDDGEEEEEWRRIDSLDNMSLFLGDNSSTSVLASTFDGCLPNCIYFSRDIDDEIFDEESSMPMIYDYGVYHMNNGAFDKHFIMDPYTRFSMGAHRPIWIIPTMNET